MPSARVERWLLNGDFVITHAALTATGITAPHKLRLEIVRGDGKGLSFNAKFKAVPSTLDEFNNSPRRELAAYEAQKLIFDEGDYVVPPTVLYCANLARYKDLLKDAEPFGDTGCTLGVLAYWVENVTDENVLDDKRFDRDPAYRYYMGNLNAFTVFIGHEDSLGDNILIAKDREQPKVLSIDNGLAFDAWGSNPFRFAARKWKRMQVDAIPAKTVKRLRELDGSDFETLGVVAEIELRRGTIAHLPKTKPLNPEGGVRREGRMIQLGLTNKEITDMQAQVAKLLAKIDEGEVKSSAPPPVSRRP